MDRGVAGGVVRDIAEVDHVARSTARMRGSAPGTVPTRTLGEAGVSVRP
jgi:hypothetical protein